jgi:hypothetical protein
VVGKIIAATKNSMPKPIKLECFNGKVIVHYEFVSCGQWTILLGVMKLLRQAEQRKRPEAWRDRTWMLHHYNTCADTLLLVHEFLATGVLARFGPC